MAEVRIRGRAQADLDDARAWFASRSTRVALQFERQVGIALDRIARMPELYALIDDRHRFCPIKKSEYHLVYRFNSSLNVVDVVAVIHAKQDTQERFG